MRNTKKRGGSAWQYTEAVYGAADKQVSNPVFGNEIAAKNLAGQAVTGGTTKRGGNVVLTDIAVPAVLLVANNFTKFKKGKYAKKTRKTYRRSKR